MVTAILFCYILGTSDIEVLLSHGPPMGILDENTGCTILRKMVGILKPTVHLFGHIHSVG
jgi:Icc-related predicted phosphoesterase